MINGSPTFMGCGLIESLTVVNWELEKNIGGTLANKRQAETAVMPQNSKTCCMEPLLSALTTSLMD